MENRIELPGEIGFNEDRMVHIVPRYPGIVKKVEKKLGSTVKKNDLLAVVESNESLTTYKIFSPIYGKIIEKHITPGEFVGEDTTLFVIVDLSTVWVNCDVYAKDADILGKVPEAHVARLLWFHQVFRIRVQKKGDPHHQFQPCHLGDDGVTLQGKSFDNLAAGDRRLIFI